MMKTVMRPSVEGRDYYSHLYDKAAQNIPGCI